ncbi:MAG: YMGG-like glycine zipper-containing protein [Gemmatimonadaceae bacterium]|nr:YMGG-like glycine zipper-containing protein [Gemmatimonadaceae bacterium]
MKHLKALILVPAAILAVTACRPDDSRKVDDALNADLTLAAQARPYTAMDSISAMERAYAAQGLAPVGYAPNGSPVYSQPVRERVVYRDRPVYRSSTSSGTSSTARRTTRIKHTQRDAAIGAVTGAAIGAVTSRDKLKGAVVGGVAGAVLGGVIGNNVDITKR